MAEDDQKENQPGFGLWHQLSSGGGASAAFWPLSSFAFAWSAGFLRSICCFSDTLTLDWASCDNILGSVSFEPNFAPKSKLGSDFFIQHLLCLLLSELPTGRQVCAKVRKRVTELFVIAAAAAVKLLQVI